MRHRLALACLLSPALALADVPRVVDARAKDGSGTWRFDVTVVHADAGWDHYADGWEIVGPDGARLGFRELLHPHDTEQPFTRSLAGVAIPAGVSSVTIRAHDSVHGWGPPFSLDLGAAPPSQ